MPDVPKFVRNNLNNLSSTEETEINNLQTREETVEDIIPDEGVRDTLTQPSVTANAKNVLDFSELVTKQDLTGNKCYYCLISIDLHYHT